MKSSLFGILPWAQRQSHKSNEINHNPVATRSNLESDIMKKKVGHANSNHNHHYCHSQRKMTPLLRLNSEGEISTGKQLCDRAVNVNSHMKKINNSLRLSNSFDSTNLAGETRQKQSRSANKSFELSSDKHIPHHPSFKKSVSEPIGLPAHQSFPPPSSLNLSAIRNNFVCQMTDTFSPFSSSPRLMGSVNIFGDSSHDNSISCIRAVSSPSENRNIMKVEMNDFKMQLKDSSSVVCENRVNMNASQLKTEREDETPQSHHCERNANSSSNSSSQNSSQSFESNDRSHILFIRNKKRKRSRSKKKRQEKLGSESSPFKPSSCSSPVSDSTISSKESTSQDSCATSSGVFNIKIVSPICHVLSKSQSNSECQQSTASATNSHTSASNQNSLGSSLFCIDSEHEDHASDDDLVFEDSNSSVVFFEDTPPSTPKIKVSSRKRKCKKNNDKSLEESDESDNEQSQKSSSISGLHFTLSLTVSEDEENDSSVDWDTSASPSLTSENDQFIFAFEFNTGLSLDAIIGQASSPECSANNKKLRDLNLQWNKVYALSDQDVSKSENCQKVHFASDDDLETIHIVGDEDRGGDWQRFALERTRFKKRIEDIGKVVAPVLCNDHRAKVYDRMNVLE